MSLNNEWNINLPFEGFPLVRSFVDGLTCLVGIGDDVGFSSGLVCRGGIGGGRGTVARFLSIA